MKRQQISQVIKLVELVHKHKNYIGKEYFPVANLYVDLLKYSRALTRIDTHYCNGTKYCESENAYAVATEKIYQKIRRALQDTGLSFYHQSDPRGVSLYIGLGEITSDNYDMNNLAIY
jgi:hypothetical protein